MTSLYNFNKFTLTADHWVCVRVCGFRIKLFKVSSYKEGVRHVNSLGFKRRVS
jgi:hypothetical protein